MVKGETLRSATYTFTVKNGPGSKSDLKIITIIGLTTKCDSKVNSNCRNRVLQLMAGESNNAHNQTQDIVVEENAEEYNGKCEEILGKEHRWCRNRRGKEEQWLSFNNRSACHRFIFMHPK